MDEKNPIQGQDVPPQSGSREYFAPLQGGQYPLATPQPLKPVESKPQQPIEQTVPAADSAAATPAEKNILDQATIDPGSQQTPLETLRTFKNDVAEAVKKQKTSVISVAVAEQKRKIERHELPPTPVSPHTESRRNILMIALSICLILGGLFAGAYAIFTYKVPPKPITIIQPGNPIISSNYQKEITIDGKSKGDLLYLIANEKTAERTAGSIESIYFTGDMGSGRKVIDFQQFLQSTQTKIPETVTRTLGPDFMLGLHSIKGGKMFLIVKPTYYEGAFPAMLDWEETMASDLSVIFNRASSTPGSAFIDKVIKNKDSRVQYDDAGNIIIIYSFVDKQHIIIAEDEETITEAYRRLTETAKIVK